MLVRLFKKANSGIGLGLLLLIVLAAAIGPMLISADPFTQDVTQSLRPPSPEHLLGTDQLGRDVLARVLGGARYTIGLGFGAVALGLFVGLPIGVASGFFGGVFDLIVQRITDALLSLPNLLLALALVAGLGVGLQNVVIAVGVWSVPGFVRLSRAATLSIREMDFVKAAIVLGVPTFRIVRRHIVPHLMSPIIVQASANLGGTILIAAGLGFLGLGVQSPTPEWGTMLAEGRNYIFSNPELTTVPGLAICLTILAFNLLGDGLRDVLDPKFGK